MSLSLSSLKPAKGARHRIKRLGRGNASGRGTTAGKGTKGQRARQGGRKGLGQFGVKHFVSHLPKVRGFQSQAIKPQMITTADLAQFAADTKVTLQQLRKVGLIKNNKKPIRLIGAAAKLNKITVSVHSVSTGARQQIEQAGGTVELVKKA